MSLSHDSGIIEFLKDSITIDSLKKKMGSLNLNPSLLSFYQTYFINNLEEAKLNFCKSLAAYSLVCYIL